MEQGEPRLTMISLLHATDGGLHGLYRIAADEFDKRDPEDFTPEEALDLARRVLARLRLVNRQTTLLYRIAGGTDLKKGETLPS